MKRLYIIGNGFDLYHKLDTSFLSFGVFLKINYPVIYDYLIQYHGIADISIDGTENSGGILWKEFESALAYLDCDMVFEDHSDYLASPGSDDFRDRDWGAFQIEIERVVDEVTINLVEAFREFILSVEYTVRDDVGLLELDENGVYLNFNYTDSLERIYEIDKKNILYLHNQASVDDTLILGHGVDPSPSSAVMGL